MVEVVLGFGFHHLAMIEGDAPHVHVAVVLFALDERRRPVKTAFVLHFIRPITTTSSRAMAAGTTAALRRRAPSYQRSEFADGRQVPAAAIQ